VESSLRDILMRDGFDVFRWEDPPDARYSAHSHDHDESLWVLEGEITFGADGKELRLVAGDRLMLPAGTVHTARSGGTGATYLIGQRRG
jgi:quercetin dioxygenase-like cupin family protein